MTAPPLVDIHCHILPAIDDGATDWSESLAMARMAVADGISTIVATPHQLGKHAGTSGELIRERAAELQQRLGSEQIPLQVLPGADVRIEPDMVPKLRSGEVVTLADQRRHVLLELPHDVYIPLERLLRELSAVQMVGILSHPERNRGILRDPSVVAPLVAEGCLMQVTAGSLLGDFGLGVQELTEQLIEEHLVHFVSSDAHDTEVRRPQLQAARQRVAELAGEELASRLCSVNPARVAAGQNVAPLPRKTAKARGLAAWLGWR